MVENGTGASRSDALVRTMMAGGYRAHGGVGHGGDGGPAGGVKAALRRQGVTNRDKKSKRVVR